MTHPMLGWGLVIGVFAIAGLPPFGMFMSEFLVVSSTFARAPWLAIPLVGGLLVAFGALLAAAPRHGFREAERRCGADQGVQPADRRAFRAGPDGRNLAAAVTGRLVSACRKPSSLTGEKIMPTLIDDWSGAQGGHESRPWPRRVVDGDLWRDLACQLGDGLLTLAGLWGDAGAVHMALLDAARGELAIASLGLRGWKVSVGRRLSRPSDSPRARDTGFVRL